MPSRRDWQKNKSTMFVSTEKSAISVVQPTVNYCCVQCQSRESSLDELNDVCARMWQIVRTNVSLIKTLYLFSSTKHFHKFNCPSRLKHATGTSHNIVYFFWGGGEKKRVGEMHPMKWPSKQTNFLLSSFTDVQCHSELQVLVVELLPKLVVTEWGLSWWICRSALCPINNPPVECLEFFFFAWKSLLAAENTHM